MNSHICVRGFKNPKNIKRELESIASDVQEIIPHASVSIDLEPESKQKQVYSLAMVVRGLNEDIVITRYDTHIYPMIWKIKKDVIRKIHQHKEKELSHRQKSTEIAS